MKLSPPHPPKKKIRRWTCSYIGVYKCNRQHYYVTLILKLKLSQTGDMHVSSVAGPVNIHQDLLFHALCRIVQCSCQKQIQNEGMFIPRPQVTFDDGLFLHMILFVKQQVINILCHWHNVVYFKKCAKDAHTTYSHFDFTTVLFALTNSRTELS